MGKIANLQKVCQDLLRELSLRQRDIILRRFGLKTGQRETLESIGKSYGITRERVRQIEEFSLAKIRPKISKFGEILEIPANFLRDWGNLKREDLFLPQLAGQRWQNHLYFLLNLADQFSRFAESEDFYPFWTIDPNSFDLAKDINNFLIDYLKRENQPLPLSQIFQVFQKKFPQRRKISSDKSLLSFVEISKEIEEGLDNLFGLRDWPEITPRGVKDKAYLALKKIGKPLHFREITSLISKLNFPQKFLKGKVLSQTVHNELIRDSRFVLVGRGTYALSEWGFKPGFVKDIIEMILKEKGPMKREEIIKEVLKQRQVKENTILMNLENKKYFSKDSQGRYTLVG